MSWLSARDGIETIGFNKGGTVTLNGARVTMVNAVHSSSVSGDAGPVYAGAEAGYMIAGEGETIYLSGDTDLMADMEWMADLHRPTIGILSAGGHFTMDMTRAALPAGAGSASTRSSPATIAPSRCWSRMPRRCGRACPKERECWNRRSSSPSPSDPATCPRNVP
ncbi:putative Zn-dependent hydrolase of the beta-lactamase fold protein [Rubellimicrobium thermophilum DSM 16684]|uniref:Putative Zn-dependent hydrolase of the beta-lactamase fold protein n=1 Tax=Rubellimicrobium thermophilum DSM 16684 TaxID=1123069 RepID=S9QZ41_9RHOB|nr:MBL fold metallo-hydrolase [Rubellimicrobium thermophilum]EPX86596.1 putative Zn-dependent hydrolase of the beta-lactamase fold protein [Rubellimicrobium thermophilum DSM 16684]